MGAKYVIDRLDGYTDGKPSWMRYGRAATKEDAAAVAEKLSKRFPLWKLRVRKASRRK